MLQAYGTTLCGMCPCATASVLHQGTCVLFSLASMHCMNGVLYNTPAMQLQYTLCCTPLQDGGRRFDTQMVLCVRRKQLQPVLLAWSSLHSLAAVPCAHHPLVSGGCLETSRSRSAWPLAIVDSVPPAALCFTPPHPQCVLQCDSLCVCEPSRWDPTRCTLPPERGTLSPGHPCVRWLVRLKSSRTLIVDGRTGVRCVVIARWRRQPLGRAAECKQP